MKNTIRIHPDAETELSQARRWYEERREGLGADFLLCVEEAVQKIQNSAETYPAVYKKARQVIVRRFPYYIIYSIEPEEIVVYSVFHASRNPETWKQRL